MHKGKRRSAKSPDPRRELSELEKPQQRAMVDGRKADFLLRAARSYGLRAHSSSDDTGRVRFIQFVRPDNGATVLPFLFTNGVKAEIAAQSKARTVALTGRQLFALTLGATHMLNPNYAHCVLYSEEIATLLATGNIPTCEREHSRT